jgi:SAM-dependent methyltransferase
MSPANTAIDNNYVQSSDGTRWSPKERPCPGCGSNATRKLGSRGGEAHRHGKGVKTTIVRCLHCEVIYTKPTLIPLDNPYDTHTTEEYFRIHDSQVKTSAGEDLAAFAEEVLGIKGKMLEIGCGRGELLLGALNRGWSVHGIEMTEGFAKVASSKGIDIERSSVEQSKSLNQTYDVILLAAILEHLYDPIAILKKVHAALRPGGLVFIDVPNERSLTMRIGNCYMRLRGKDWTVNLSPTFSPFHVVGFSPKSLAAALNSTGFRVLHLGVERWANSLPEGGGLIDRVERLGLNAVQKVGSMINMADGIRCWAVRD